MVDMNATASASGLKHPIGNNIEVLPEIENEDCETVTIIADHEEGQIIEDVEFEDISSDEDPIVFTEADEASMRKRIEELELRNAELEKIANISVINNYDLGTNKNVPQAENKIVDIIELSDYDEYPPNEIISSAFVPYDTNYNTLNYYSEFTKINSCFPPNSIKTYHKSRKHRKRAHSSENKNYDESRSGKICRYKKRRRRSRSSSLGVSNTARQKSSNAKHHHSRSKRSKRKRRVKNQYDSFSNNSDSEKSEGFELDREELRKAVKRNSETIRKGNLQNIVSNKKNKIMNENKDNKNDDDVIEIENNKEVEQITSKLTNEDKDNNVLVSDDSESLEEQTLRLIALKSAIVKKHLDRQKRKELEEKKPYSPSDFDYWCTGINTQNSPKDFDDLECTDSNNISPSESPINISEEETNTKPIDIEIDNSDSDSDIPQFIDTPTPWQSTLSSLDILKKLAPPPPQITLFSPTELRVDNKYIKDCIEDNSKLIISQKNSSPEDLSDEEELALRALLLSKMNSPKVNNIVTKKTILTENSQNTVINKIIDTHTKNVKLDILENSKSPNLIEAKDSIYNDSNTDLFQNILEKAKNTESLLKEAVKRLKTTTLNDLSENDDISDGNNYHNQNKADKCKQLTSNIKNNFKEIQFSIDRELSESILETNIVSPNSSNGHELLIKSRKKLNNFMQGLNKEKLSNCELDEIQNSTETSDEDQEQLIDNNSCDIEKPEEENRSQTCIEALQKIIELNYQKLVNVEHETNIVEFSAEHEKEIITDVEIPLSEESSLQEHSEHLKSKKSCLPEQTEILKPLKRGVSCSPEPREMLKQHEKEESSSFKRKETLKQSEKEESCSIDNVQISKPSFFFFLEILEMIKPIKNILKILK